MRSYLFHHLAMAAVAAATVCCGLPTHADEKLAEAVATRSPVDLAFSADGDWIVTANQTSNTVSLIRWPAGTVADEVRVGRRPEAVMRISDSQFLVSCSRECQVVRLAVEGGRLKSLATVALPGQPVGLAVSADAATAYVALQDAGEVVELALDPLRVTRRIPVGRWPKFLALAPDQRRLAVSTSGDRGLTVVDLPAGQVAYQQSFIGLNIGHLDVADDGQVYFPWMVYRRNPITAGNIRLGWVLASRIGRLRPESDERREAFSLDPPGKAIADPFGLRVTRDQQRLVVSASGTHELLVYRIAGLPFQRHGGSDHIDPQLLADEDRFFRIELGGRPMGLRIAPDDRTVVVADYLAQAVICVDLDARQVTKRLSLGPQAPPTPARQGEAIFYDARRSLDQWYSCHSCHQDGGTNAVTMDTFNDGSARSFKTVLPLYNVTRTAPWTWHGWQEDFRDAMEKSLTTTMLGPQPTAAEVDALIAFLDTLEAPPARAPQNLSAGEAASAARGRQLFESVCRDCHAGPHYTDGQIHDVNLGSRGDRYQGFNTPSLLGVSRKTKLLHDGRVSTLTDLLKGPHAPSEFSDADRLFAQQIEDLVAFLNTL